MYDFFALFLVSLWIAVQTKASASSCQVYPSEYAYHRTTVYRNESGSANCRNYPHGLDLIALSQEYIHCDGTPLRLTDSDLGSEPYNTNDYYVWNSHTIYSQLLFIFPTRVNLTTITLHYYSDSVRGLPRLRFWAAPNEFDIWDAPATSYSYVDVAAVPPDEEPTGHKNVSVDFNTMKILLYRFTTTFTFAVSEVQFIKSTYSNHQATTTVSKVLKTVSSDLSTTTNLNSSFTTESRKTTTFSDNTETLPSESITSMTVTEDLPEENKKKNALIPAWITIGVVSTILMLLVIITVIITLALYLRKSSQQKTENDNSYCVFHRKGNQQLQPQSLHTTNDLYDHIQLSPSTGQAEFISETESDNTNNPSSSPHQHQHNIHHSVDTEQPKSATLQITDRSSTNILSHEIQITIEHPTYAVVNKKKERKKEKEPVHCPPKTSAATSVTLTKQNSTHNNIHSQPVKYAAKVDQPILCNQEIQDNNNTAQQISSQTAESPEELYTAVRKKTKESTAQNEELPPISLQGVEQLYTAVNKKTQPKTANDEVKSPPIPPHTVEELYTAVMKKPKARETDDEVEAPPVPPHTVEKLYTAVQKNKN